MLFVYQLLRFLFFVFNYQHFNDVGLYEYMYICYGALRFDIAVLLYINSLYILAMLIPFDFRKSLTYQKCLNYIFLITNSIGIFANVADIAYFPFTLRRTTIDFFREFKNDTNLIFEVLKYFKEYWYLIIVLVLIIYALKKIVGRKIIYVSFQKPLYKNYVFHSLILLLTIGLCFGGVRGSFKFKTRPINVGRATEYANKAIQVNLVLNTPFSILFTIENRHLPEKKYFSDENILKANFNPEQIFSSEKTNKKNVVIIIVESLSREFVGGLNKHIEGFVSYTPFLDSLIESSYTSRVSFANGRRSIEALPATLASLPTLNESFVLTPYSGNEFKSLAHVLKENGYATSFYHGAHRGSMGFWAFMKLAGFEKYYGQEDFANDVFFDGTWGIWDEEFLQYWAANLNKENEPFLSCAFTVSSHNPYAIPERYKNKFNKGEAGIQNAISYTDNALRQFFNTAKKSKWYNNTLFVITADHTASENYYPTYCNEVANYAAPIIFYAPDKSVPAKIITKPIQQSDIYPSVVDYLNISDTIVAFGKSVFDTLQLKNKFAITCRLGLYQLMTDSMVLQYDSEKDQFMGYYNYWNDRTLTNNLANSRKEECEKNLLILKAYVQQYTNRLRNNKLVPSK